MSTVYNLIKKFKSKYNMTLAVRLKAHSLVVERYLNPGEKVIYAFPAQNNDRPFNIINSCVVAVTDRRILVGHKGLIWGHWYYSITPDLFNDLKVYTGIIWSRIDIDTIKELVTLTNIDKKAAPEIETKVTSFMMTEKKKYKIGKDGK